MYQVCKTFEFESGHLLSKSRDRCRDPHGHSRRVEVVLAAEELDPNDMVCNFRWIKLALADILNRLDHAICINDSDPRLKDFKRMQVRLEVFKGQDPTSEVIARMIFDHLEDKLAKADELTSENGNTYSLSPGVRLSSVRLWETSTSWSEYSR